MIGIAINAKDLTAALARMGPEGVAKIVIPALDRRANEARREAVKVFTSRGVGRGIFGRRESGAYSIIRLDPVDLSRGGIVARITASGFARLQETGGRTKRHFIRKGKRRGKTLAFAVPGGFGFGGDMGFAAWVDHPGGTVKSYPAVLPAAVKAQTLLVEDLRVKVAALWGGKAA